MKAKIEELDLVRAFAILGVLFIHGTSQSLVKLIPGTSTHTLFLFINKMSNFAVPVFIFLSAVVLFYRYDQDFSWKQCLNFYKKRLLYILVPYLIWSLAYSLYYYNILPHWKGYTATWDIEMFLEKLQRGQAAPHLYFFIIIFQFYVLFPLLIQLFQLLRKHVWLLVLLGIAVQVGFYLYAYEYGPIQNRASYCFGYFGLFTIGGVLGMYYRQAIAWMKKYGYLFLALATIFGLTLVRIYYLSFAHLQTPPTYVYDAIFHLYALFMGISLIWLSVKIIEILSPTSFIIRSLKELGVVSFGIYLTHVVLLDILRKTVVLPGQPVLYILYTGGFIVIITFVPWAMVRWIKRWKYSWILFGR